MVKPEFDNLVRICGGLSGFSREISLCGSRISANAIRRWYESRNLHPQKKYFAACIKVAKKKGVKTDFLEG